MELYNKNEYNHNLINQVFVQDNISVSSRNVLRGIHGDNHTWKLVSCLSGRIYLVVVCCDPLSPQFKQWQSFILSDANRLQVLVPPKHGNGHLVLSKKAIFHYKMSKFYNLETQFTIQWDDPSYKIEWPIENPILSKRDTSAGWETS